MRITEDALFKLDVGELSLRYQFHENIDPAERMDELKLEVTAPTIAANPKSATQRGTKFSNNKGTESAGSDRLPFQYTTASIPKIKGGMVMRMVVIFNEYGF
jgi:hypothetical protein